MVSQSAEANNDGTDLACFDETFVRSVNVHALKDGLAIIVFLPAAQPTGLVGADSS